MKPLVPQLLLNLPLLSLTTLVPTPGLLEDMSMPGEMLSLDGRNRARVIAESLARIIAAIRITSVRWRSYLPLKHRIWSL